MSPSKPHTARKFIVSLNMDKLRGRMLIMPKSNIQAKNEILIVYGQKSTLEKWFGLADELRKYGNVTMPDLPGYGGMQSFYKINEKPTLDNYADYLAAFIKLRYRRKKIIIVGLSFGFVIVTRMLQKYPDLIPRVNVVINVFGFAHNSDIKFKEGSKNRVKLLSKLLSGSQTSAIYRSVIYHPNIFPKISRIQKKYKSEDLERKELDKVLKLDLKIQQKNDTRTHMYTLHELLKLDNTQQTIDLPVWSIIGRYDGYLNTESVQKNVETIYSKSFAVKVKKNGHSNHRGFTDKEEIAALIPYKLKNVLRKNYK